METERIRVESAGDASMHLFEPNWVEHLMWFLCKCIWCTDSPRVSANSQLAVPKLRLVSIKRPKLEIAIPSEVESEWTFPSPRNAQKQRIFVGAGANDLSIGVLPYRKKLIGTQQEHWHAVRTPSPRLCLADGNGYRCPDSVAALVTDVGGTPQSVRVGDDLGDVHIIGLVRPVCLEDGGDAIARMLAVLALSRHTLRHLTELARVEEDVVCQAREKRIDVVARDAMATTGADKHEKPTRERTSGRFADPRWWGRRHREWIAVARGARGSATFRRP